MNSNVLRALFLDFFHCNGHKVYPSASLIPNNDPSLLFTNAGMNPFKGIFLGDEQVDCSRATSSQRCMRAGGKHNDLENVGYTARHHTFFEMLGNFSFGDYFKREAIQYSWKFLTEVLKLPPKKLWITVFEEDDEASDIWLNEIKIDPSRFSRCGSKDNFWSMGDTGPCGPCSEIFYDYGPSVAGGPPGSENSDGDRYVEIWNLVFMQFQRAADGTLDALPMLSVDTGMGLERLAAVMQGVTNNFNTDLFLPLIKNVAEQAGISDLANTSLRVIADHIRSCAFLIFDGILPGNEGRSYVLRRIIRRAIRHGHKIGLDKSFFYSLVKPLAKQMREVYPELEEKRSFIEKIILQEEQQFARTLTRGLKLLEQAIGKLKGNKQLPGDVVFLLYDTYGFPVDLTADVVREHGLTIDMPGFESEMQRQRSQSKAGSQFATATTLALNKNSPTEFTGYEKLSQTQVPVTELLKNNVSVESLTEGDEGTVILEKTPFYAESGGQVGDTGQLINENAEFLVTNTKKKGDIILHVGRLAKGSLRTGDEVNANVDIAKRQAITINHSATHLLHAALRQILGEHVVQKGSLVEAERLRFDFSHNEPVSTEILKEVEDRVNQQIRANFPIQTQVKSPEAAKRDGALAIFGEKYGDSVRVLTMGDFSKELCGGTHASRTGDIGLFKIIGETGIAAGIRRLQAVTGQAALNWITSLEEQTRQLAKLFKASNDNLVEKAQKEVQSKQALQKQIEELQRSVLRSKADDLVPQAIEICGTPVLTSVISGVDRPGLAYLLDLLKNKLNRAVIILASTNHGHTYVLISVTKELTNQIKANELANEIAKLMGAKGGGRADFAQVGSEKSVDLEVIFKNAKNWVETHLNRNYA